MYYVKTCDLSFSDDTGNPHDRALEENLRRPFDCDIESINAPSTASSSSHRATDGDSSAPDEPLEITVEGSPSGPEEPQPQNLSCRHASSQMPPTSGATRHVHCHRPSHHLLLPSSHGSMRTAQMCRHHHTHGTRTHHHCSGKSHHVQISPFKSRRSNLAIERRDYR